MAPRKECSILWVLNRAQKRFTSPHKCRCSGINSDTAVHQCYRSHFGSEGRTRRSSTVCCSDCDSDRSARTRTSNLNKTSRTHFESVERQLARPGRNYNKDTASYKPTDAISIENQVSYLTYLVQNQGTLLQSTLSKVERFGLQLHQLESMCEMINHSINQLCFDHFSETRRKREFVPNLSKFKVSDPQDVDTELTLKSECPAPLLKQARKLQQGFHHFHPSQKHAEEAWHIILQTII